MIQLAYTASVTQWPVTIWTSLSWHCSSTWPWWQVQEHERPFNAAMSKHLYTSYSHTYFGYHCPEKHLKTWTCSPAQVLIRSLILSSSTQRKQFRMNVVRDTQNTFASPSYWIVPSVPVRRCHPTSLEQSQNYACTQRIPTTSPKNYRLLAINGCKSIDFLQTWSATCWWTGLVLNIKYQTLNLVSATQGTPTNPSIFCDTFSRLLKEKNKGIHCFPGPLCCLRQCSKREASETLAKE
jgi:hypothetical protein